ncbi:hypothetical protein [Prolixibacter sp. SD074]|uniref:hypothetical protein n=1 Tax=Prolixibacter sp. SD074 TaxID=2652391 RepID=UPI00127B7DBD|nr:hypothetical protein [Prolixibacter sp. SD074]GET30515.1 hypothetical protein SD074_27170 [Prolixibacter sp. SD074]
MDSNQQNNRFECLTKSQLAGLCNVSMTTMRTWLNVRYYPELKKLGYHRRQKILLPPQVKFLVETLAIVIDDE